MKRRLFVNQDGIRWALLQGTKLRSPSQRLVLMIIGMHFNREGACFPSIERLARLAGKSRGDIKRLVGELFELGILRIETGGRRPGQTNIYRAVGWPPPDVHELFFDAGAPEEDAGEDLQAVGTSDPEDPRPGLPWDGTHEGAHGAISPPKGTRPRRERDSYDTGTGLGSPLSPPESESQRYQGNYQTKNQTRETRVRAHVHEAVVGAIPPSPVEPPSDPGPVDRQPRLPDPVVSSRVAGLDTTEPMPRVADPGDRAAAEAAEHPPPPAPPNPRPDRQQAPSRLAAPTPEEMQAVWNQVMRGSPIPMAFKLTDERRRRMRALAADLCADGVEVWRTVCLGVRNDPWCRGERPGQGHDNWTATLDWALRGPNTLRYLEAAASRRQRVDAQTRASPAEMDPFDTGDAAVDAANRRKLALLERALGERAGA